MQAYKLRSMFSRTLLLCMSLLMLVSYRALAGGDSYEISLNNKVLVKQALYEPFNLQSLDLSAAKSTDHLTIRFLQCNKPGKTGKSRSISIRDEQGKIVKEWRFKDNTGNGNEMTIPVKDIVELQKSSPSRLLVYYYAEGYEKGQKLAALEPGNRKTT